jgi:enamine deaminase RidA (YjgF/YER057c/UK114 family)
MRLRHRHAGRRSGARAIYSAYFNEGAPDIRPDRLPNGHRSPKPIYDRWSRRRVPVSRSLISSGSPFEKQAGYSRAVVDGDWVFVSGTTGYDYET